MKAIELTAPCIDALQQSEHDMPRPGRGDVLLRVHATSLNFLDIAVASGDYPVPAFPIVPGTDAAGEIVELGEDVVDWALGDEVIPHFLPHWIDGALTPQNFIARRGVTITGSLAEYLVVPASSLVAKPAHLNFSEAATLPIAATTAWRAVRSIAPGPQSTVLLLGTGGVSIFALQFAKAHSARVIITSSSDDKLARARELGADDTVNYRTVEAWDEEVLRLTDGRGVDLVLETGGEATLRRSANAAALNATLFIIGFLSGHEPTIDVLPVMEKQLRIQGNNTGPVVDLAEAAAAISAHVLRPVVDRVFAMDDVVKAYEHVAAGGRHFGKVVVRVD